MLSTEYLCAHLQLEQEIWWYGHWAVVVCKGAALLQQILVRNCCSSMTHLHSLMAMHTAFVLCALL